MKSIFTVLIFTNLLLASNGATLYSFCAGCHGQSGEKSALGKSSKIGGQSASKTLEQLKQYKEGTLNLYGMGGLMKGQTSTLSDAELSLLATHVEQLNNPKDKVTRESSEHMQKQLLYLCSKEKDDKKRLSCYDGLDKQINKQQPTKIHKKEEKNKEAPVEPASKGKWDVSITTSEIDDSQKVILSLSSDNTIYSSYRTERPSLYLRCAENKTEAYIAWGVFLGSDNTKVLLRYDKEKAKTRRWGLSTDHKATFVRGNIPFIKKLLKHKKLLLRVTPYSDSPVTATFDLRGLNEAIKPLRKACHW